MTGKTTSGDSEAGVLRPFFTVLFLFVCIQIAMFWRFASIDTPWVFLFVLAATAGYAALYLLVPVALTGLTRWLTYRVIRSVRWQTGLTYFVACLGGSFVLLCIYADFRLYELYEFHFNGFVWNLLTTSGGIEALGATESTQITVVFQVGLIVAGTALSLGLLHRYRSKGTLPRFTLQAIAGIALLALVSEEGVYAYSTFTGNEEYIQAAEVVPFHLHTSLTTLFKHMNIKRTSRSNLRIAGGEVDYPNKNLDAVPLKRYPNIIMLVGESFRWDLLDPEITPNLWKLSEQSLRFEHHYSGGNRTRMGLFSMFYGVYAPYWYSFEKQRVTPAFMEFLKVRNYQIAAHTSQSFDYPELRHTVFAGIDEQYLQELRSGEPWERDTQNIGDIITKIERRDRQRPFYGFMFFESTHAPYSFPEEDVMRNDYQKDLNYITMNLRDNIKQIHARYINAAHHIDREVGRLLDHLRKSGMMENTIVLFTGDHGEEFMEKGHWGHGHGSTFPEEQIRVPLVLHVPGRKPEVVRHRTTHLEIAPTLLSQIGVRQPPRTYSSADTLFSPNVPYFVLGEYDFISIMDSQVKITFPFTGRNFFRYTVHDANDQPVPREKKQKIIEQYQARIDEVVAESRRFVR